MENVLAFCAPKRGFPVMSQDKPQKCEKVAQPRRPSEALKTNPQTTVILMRHGMTDWNQEGRVQGGLDKSRLNNKGLEQARRAGVNLRNVPIETVLCSPLRRAKDTFEHLVESSANADLIAKTPGYLPELKEFQVPWQGSLITEIPEGPFKREYAEYRRNPMRFSFNGFSPIRDLSRRAEHIWETICRGQACSYLIISHNQMNKALISAALQMPTNLSTWNQTNCSFNVFSLEDGKPARLHLCNGTDLPGPASLSRRARPRRKFLRLVLHHQGHVDGLLHETSGQTISHTCCIGKGPSGHFEVSTACANVESRSNVTLPANQVHEDMYLTCLSVLDGIRRNHNNGCVVVSAENNTVHCALIAACLGMGHEGITKLISDPGGVTVIDVESSVDIGTGRATVQCHNNYAHRNTSGGFLLGYTNRSITFP